MGNGLGFPKAQSLEPKAYMTRLNGDKSRHQINRKRVVLRREKIRKLVEAAKARSSAKAEPVLETSRPASEKSR